jgi:chemotaxis protein MotB
MNPDAPTRKSRPPEAEEDGFMVSYSALMILLLTFMILMVTLANFKETRFRKAIGSVKGAFSFLPYAGGDNLMGPGSPGVLPVEILLKSSEEDQQAYEETVEEMKAKAESPDLPGFEVEEREGGLAIRASDELLFGRGKADLRPDVLPVMDLVARAIKLRPGRVSVVGNTCDLPISTAEFPSNWELSMMRAVSVVHHLEDQGVNPEYLYAYGLSDQWPIAEGDNEESRRQNRRVEIYIANRGEQVEASSEVQQ